MRMYVKILVKDFLLKTLLPGGILLSVVVLSICPCSCRASLEEVDVLEGDFSVPHIYDFSVTGASVLVMEFTKEITLENASVFSKDTEENFCKAQPEYSEDHKTAMIHLESPTEIGHDYVLEGQVKDVHGNSLTFSLPFRGFNENPAKVILSEVRNAYGTASVKDSEGTSQKVHRSEYVELYVLKSGNLCGIEVCSASDGEERMYVVPPVEVMAGDYVTVHMRTVDSDGFDGEGMTSELGDDLTLSTHEDSCPTARDLWSENSKACFADSDIVFLRNNYDGTILDALVFAKSKVTAWKDSFLEVVSAVEESGVWSPDASPANGICSDLVTSTAATRSYSRQNIEETIEAVESGLPIENNASVWMITANSGSGKKMVPGITPGLKNSSNEYKK